METRTPPAVEPTSARRLVRRAAVWAAPLVLVVVAVVQIVRVHTLDQSSWVGVGFGMFATYESEQTRFVQATLTLDDGAVVAVSVPDGEGDLVREVLEVPTDANAERLATVVAAAHPEATEVAVVVHGIDVVVVDAGERRLDVSRIDLAHARVSAPGDDP